MDRAKQCPMCGVTVTQIATVVGVSVRHFFCPICKRVWVGDPTPLTLCAQPDRHVTGERAPGALRAETSDTAA